MMQKLSLYLEKLKVLLSTMMELLGFWWLYLSVERGGGMMVGLHER